MRSEKIYKICGMIICWIPFIFIIISSLVNIPAHIEKLIWLIIFIVNIALILVSLKTFKNLKRSENNFKILGLMLLIGYIGYFILDLKLHN